MQQEVHHTEADMAYDSKNKDKTLSLKNKSVKMYTFDLQQCLQTPHLNASVFFYKRPLWTFNLTIHDGETNMASCFIWNETIAKRGANEISSCIFKFLKKIPNYVKHIILYSDSCPGQNRNSYICAMFEQVLLENPNFEIIDHKFLVVGHTHMECDTVHSQIEKKKRKCVNCIHHPHDWATLISTTSHKYSAVEMAQEEFFDFGTLLKDKYSWTNKNNSGDKFQWKDVRWLRYESSKLGTIQYKLSLNMDEEFKDLVITRRGKKKIDVELNQCYSGPLPISLNKKRDLQSILPFISAEFHDFYNNLLSEGEQEVEVDLDLDDSIHTK
ncbi:uncharacterized protein LOC142229878 [Haematobia irritans]|uniref:uncharacterized protein LOC142229878 n=1 Tax=Haematobia irritans TaxID=7368 RepID=UPI003F4F8BA0